MTVNVNDWGRNIVTAWAFGFVEGLGHKIEEDRCIRCGDALADIQDRIGGSYPEQLVFGELRCSGS